MSKNIKKENKSIMEYINNIPIPHRWYGADNLTWNTSFIICGNSPFRNLNLSIAHA